MTETAEDPLGIIDALVEVIGIAHAAVFDWHRVLVNDGRDSEETRALLQESVEIAFTETPTATARARELADPWSERQLLDPEAAPATLADLESVVAQAQGRLRQLLQREQEIANTLRELARGPGER